MMDDKAPDTPEEFCQHMQDIVAGYKRDPEVCHELMDALMVIQLERLGFGAGTKIFESSDRWYA